MTRCPGSKVQHIVENVEWRHWRESRAQCGDMGSIDFKTKVKIKEVNDFAQRKAYMHIGWWKQPGMSGFG